MTNVAKGKRAEKYAREDLKALGYLVEVKNYSRWQLKDFYNLFDILAIIGSTAKLIQIKSNLTDFYKARKNIIAWKKENNIRIQCEVWLWEGRDKKTNLWRIDECKVSSP